MISGSGNGCCRKRKALIVWWMLSFWMQQQPIFPDRRQSSIVGASELNYCVRYENRWDLTANVTAMVYIGFLRVYRFLVHIHYTLFWTARQFLYTIDSQLHRTFLIKYILSPWLIFVKAFSVINSLISHSSWDQALDLLVSVSSTHYCAYTPDLSNLLSSSGLTNLRYGISYLEASFTLRCFQRLSNPHFAILPCRWRDNRCTIGAFIPVLSY